MLALDKPGLNGYYCARRVSVVPNLSETYVTSQLVS